VRRDVDFVAEVLTLPTGPMRVLRAPGVALAAEATEALLRAVGQFAGRRVCVLGPGMTGAAVWAAQTGAEVAAWTEHCAEAETLRATFTALRLPAPQLLVGANFAGLAAESCDTVCLYLPRGREVQTELVELAAALLRPGGWLGFVGAKREGVRHVLQEAQRVFGQAGIVAHKGGYQAGLAQRPPGDFPFPALPYTERAVLLDGVATRLITRPGVFAWAGVDDGAAALIAGMEIVPGEQVLDLGCGAGVVGLAALRRGAQVTCSDVSVWAVEAARRTLAANGYPIATVRHACGAAGVPDGTLDVVLLNPPFHQGQGVDYEAARWLMAEAARGLRSGGRLYLVANTFLKYAPWLVEHFRAVTPVGRDARFTVWCGTR